MSDTVYVIINSKFMTMQKELSAMDTLYMLLYFAGGLTLSGLIMIYGMKKIMKSLSELNLNKK